MSRIVANFSEFQEHDTAVSAWFANYAWPVSSWFIDDDRDVFAWRHEGATRADNRPLRVTQYVLEDVPPHILAEYLQSAAVADTLVREAVRYVVVQQVDGGNTGVVVLDAAPELPR